MNQSGVISLILAMLVIGLLSVSCSTPEAPPIPVTTSAPTETDVASPTDNPGVVQTHIQQIETVKAQHATQVFDEGLPALTRTATATATRTPTLAPPATRTAQADAAATAHYSLELTAQAIADRNPMPFPYDWPVEFSEQQIEAARACDIWTLYDERYADVLSVEFLASAFDPQTACDWAVLATAYAYYAGEHEVPIPEMGKETYLAAISQNPALLLLNPMFFGYLDEYPLVDPPPFTNQPVVTAMLQYNFGGIGYLSNFTILITNASTSPTVKIFGEEFNSFAEDGVSQRDLSYNGPISYQLAQGLGRGLTDLVPVDTRFHVIGCFDYYPNWDVILTFADGTSLHVLTNGSNLFDGGGPWQVAIDGQDYVQASGAFANAVGAITEELDLPGGATAAMSCHAPQDLIIFGYPLPGED